jgi:hypothetical protein
MLQRSNMFLRQDHSGDISLETHTDRSHLIDGQAQTACQTVDLPSLKHLHGWLEIVRGCNEEL